MYFLKTKKDTVSATKKFIADTAPHVRIKSLRSDNGSEFKSNDFQRLLCDNSIGMKLLRLIHHTKMGQQKEIDEPYLKWLDAWSLKTTCLKVYGPIL